MHDTSEMIEFFDRDDSFYIERKKYLKDLVLIPMVYVDLEDYNAATQKDKEKLEKNIEKAQRALDKDPDRKSTRLNSSHVSISYAVFCLKKKKRDKINKYFGG